MTFPTLTKDQLEEACEEWQKRLRLQDWDIDIHVVRYHELESQGNCTVTQQLKYARIKIRDGNDSPRDSKCDYDMESALLHELMHVHFDAVKNDWDSIIPNPGNHTAGLSHKDMCIEQAFCGIVPWMMSVGRVIRIKVSK